jgi:hypothetical protein
MEDPTKRTTSQPCQLLGFIFSAFLKPTFPFPIFLAVVGVANISSMIFFGCC